MTMDTMSPDISNLALPEETSNFGGNEVNVIGMAEVVDIQLLRHWKLSNDDTLVLFEIFKLKLAVRDMHRHVLIQLCKVGLRYCCAWLSNVGLSQKELKRY